MAKSLSERVQSRRDALRHQGLRPVQIWLPDVRRPGFDEELRRQARIIAEADRADPDLLSFLDAAAADLDAMLK
ncbi:antitoxin MazE family protein [Rhizobium sp.]